MSAAPQPGESLPRKHRRRTHGPGHAQIISDWPQHARVSERQARAAKKHHAGVGPCVHAGLRRSRSRHTFHGRPPPPKRRGREQNAPHRHDEGFPLTRILRRKSDLPSAMPLRSPGRPGKESHMPKCMPRAGGTLGKERARALMQKSRFSMQKKECLRALPLSTVALEGQTCWEACQKSGAEPAHPHFAL